MITDRFDAVIGFFRALHQYLFIEDDRIGEQIVLFDVAGDRNIAGDYVALVIG